MPRRPWVARLDRTESPQPSSTSRLGRISSTARMPTTCCSLLKAMAAASRTSELHSEGPKSGSGKTKKRHK